MASPAAAISGTVKQQSKSYVRVSFTWKQEGHVEIIARTIINLIYLKYTIEGLKKPGQVGWTAFPYPVDVNAALVQPVRHAETEIFVHGILVQRHLKSDTSIPLRLNDS